MLKTIITGFAVAAPLTGMLLFGLPQFALATEADLKPDTSKPAADIESFYAGDKLRVTVFENIARRQTETGSLYNLVERSEISGSFTVGLDGRIVLPFAGSTPILNRGQQTVEQQIEDAYRNQLGGSVKVVVRLEEREPVYVTGSVARPGSAKYVPGMTVLHALAMTGSNDVTGADQWKAFEMAREQERVSKAKERLARLTARRSVLLEERDAKLPATSTDTATLDVIAAEVRVRQLECLAKINHDEALRELITATEGELRILNERLAALETNLAEKAARVSELTSLRARGTTTDANYYLTRSELGLTQDHWHEVRTAIAQVSKHLSELRIQQSQSAIDFELARERDIAGAEKAIAEEELTAKIMGTLTLQTAAMQSEKRGGFQLRLIRRTVKGAEQTIVDDAALLEPGDIISVDRVALTEMSATKVFKDPADPRM